jgi:hypothetical protein
MFSPFMKRFCLGLVFVLSCGCLAEAAFLRNVPVHVNQPDGTVLSCLASGDEFYNWLHDKDGFTIMRNPATGFLSTPTRSTAGSCPRNSSPAGPTPGSSR